MRLPEFLRTGAEPAAAGDLADAFTLTGFFLDRHAFAPRGLPMPDARGPASFRPFLSVTANRGTAHRHDQRS